MSEPTVYYDGACPLCRAEIGMYRGMKGGEGLCFIDVASLPTDPADDLSKQAAMARFHMRDENGRLVDGAAAFALLWRQLPALRWIGILASWPIMAFVLEWGYRGFLPLRPWLARRFNARDSARAKKLRFF